MSNIKVLLADDSPIILEMIEYLLTGSGYEVITAGDGVEAVEKAFEHYPDIILLDVVMPRMTGHQACRLLKHEEYTREIPIIILTSQDHAGQKFWGLHAGADDYITKDFDPAELIDMIEHRVEISRAKQSATGGDREYKKTEKIDIVSAANALLDRQLYESTIINEIGKLAYSLQDFNGTLIAVLKIISDLIQYNAGAFIVAGDEGEAGVFCLNVNGNISQEYFEELRERSIRELEIFSGRHFKVDDFRYITVEKDPVAADREAEKKIGRYLSVTVQGREGVIGLIAITGFGAGEFDKNDESALKLVSLHTYTSIDNARLYEKVRRLSIMDGLLKDIYNRRYVEERLDQEFERSIRYHRDLSVMILDMDKLKEINDTYGHQAGDSALKILVSLIRRVMRSTDVIGRYGGDEFIIIMPETTGEGAAVLAERLRKLVDETKFFSNDEPDRITVSIGVSTYPSIGVNSSFDLVNTADRALYRAKNSGRNRVCVYEIDEE